MPAIAAAPRSGVAHGCHHRDPAPSRATPSDTVPTTSTTCRRLPVDLDHVGDVPGERERVAGVRRSTEPQLAGRGPAPPGPAHSRDVALHEPGRREDVEEDVLRPALRGQVAVVVDVLEVPGGQRGADHEGRGDRQLPGRERRADVGLVRLGVRRTSLPIGRGGPERRERQLVVDLGRTRRAPASPISTVSGSTPRSSPIIRTPSSSSTTARSERQLLARGSAARGGRRRSRRVPRPGRHDVPAVRRPGTAGHIGPGGCRSAPQALHCWIRSSPAAGALPEERRVLVRSSGARSATGRPGRRPPWPRVVLQHPEQHRRDLLVADPPGAERGDEVALADAGPLRARRPTPARWRA